MIFSEVEDVPVLLGTAQIVIMVSSWAPVKKPIVSFGSTSVFVEFDR